MNRSLTDVGHNRYITKTDSILTFIGDKRQGIGDWGLGTGDWGQGRIYL
ncbi:hypothetical protein ACQFX9_23740 [Aliinostoc sp. HNIBRCY26]